MIKNIYISLSSLKKSTIASIAGCLMGHTRIYCVLPYIAASYQPKYSKHMGTISEVLLQNGTEKGTDRHAAQSCSNIYFLRSLIYCFTSHSRIFHLYGDVTNTDEGLQNLGLCSVLWAFERGGIFIVPHLL
jgi:hypothetical protein